MLQAEAQRIIQANNQLVSSDGSRGRQLGDGAYLGVAFQKYDSYPESYDCAVKVDPAAWAGVKKAWIPQYWNHEDKCLYLWTPRGGE